MTQKFDKHILKNKMVILAEQMPSVESVAFDFIMPAGASTLPKNSSGAANIISDWIFRGAGQRDNRQLNNALDNLGLHKSTSITSSHLSIGAALHESNLKETLDLYADIILKPSLLPDQFELAKKSTIDEVLGLDDDPRRNVMLKLRENFYPAPLGQSPLGSTDDLQNLTAEKTSKILKENFNLSGTIFSVAGKYDFESVVEQLEALFETNEPVELQKIEVEQKGEKYTHVPNQGAQVHIGLMTPTVTPVDPDYYNARVAISVLSGGMSARLFTEVREKRGLCYAIGARYHALKNAAGIMCYAGTTPDKAQQTIDVIIEQFLKLKNDISEDEIQIAKVGLKSALILQSESSSARASAIAYDYYMRGKIQTLDQIKNNIEKISLDSVISFLNKKPIKDFTVVTIGPNNVNLG